MGETDLISHRDRRPGGKFPRVLIMAALILAAAALSGCRSSEGDGSTVILYGFSALENVMKEEIIPAFQRDWRRRLGRDVQVITSFAGSGTITNQIIFGAPAQVAMVATEMDALNMKKAGLIDTDWRRFGNQGSFAYTVACIVTRKGNPKRIHSFEDTTKEGVDVVYPDPATSGGAQWAILALYGSALRISELTTGIPDQARAREQLKLANLNAGSLPESARRALTQFGLGFGDALLTYENEAMLDISNGKEYEIVVPESTIYIEPKVVLVDRNVDEQATEVVTAFLDFLSQREAQEAFARNYFRVWDRAIMEKYSHRYKSIEFPFDVEYLGGWEEATSTLIDKMWKQIQRETG